MSEFDEEVCVADIVDEVSTYMLELGVRMPEGEDTENLRDCIRGHVRDLLKKAGVY